MRFSLDVLDQVIGEFDDGLTSATESEFAPRWRQPPVTRRQSPPIVAEERIRPEIRPEIRGSALSINEQIDDIFSELTEEVYNDDKVTTRTDRRRIFDPLPSPPNKRTHPPPIDRKKKPEISNGRTDIADIRSRTIENDRSMLVGNVVAKKQFLERNSAASSSGGRSKTGSSGERYFFSLFSFFLLENL